MPIVFHAKFTDWIFVYSPYILPVKPVCLTLLTSVITRVSILNSFQSEFDSWRFTQKVRLLYYSYSISFMGSTVGDILYRLRSPVCRLHISVQFCIFIGKEG